ncbi:MAG TPA: hypothetical protein VNS32_18075, partial [Flavisolibacter sp.]|nr:hypothetical protein [Flavisolibacter sp.]
MKLVSRILLSAILLVFAALGKAQNPISQTTHSNLRVKTIQIKGDSILLDSLSIIPNTFHIQGTDNADYRLDFVRSILFWHKRPQVDSITIRYRVFSYRLNAVVQHLSFDSVMNNVYLRPYEFNPNENIANKGLFDFGNIQYNGSFGRELSFGNSQDAVVNSNFQLQLNGMLKDSIEIAAALTDNNLPIQPDGTTQQLNEFDQVFLQFKKHNWQLNLGDID